MDSRFKTLENINVNISPLSTNTYIVLKDGVVIFSHLADPAVVSQVCHELAIFIREVDTWTSINSCVGYIWLTHTSHIWHEEVGHEDARETADSCHNKGPSIIFDRQMNSAVYITQG